MRWRPRRQLFTLHGAIDPPTDTPMDRLLVCLGIGPSKTLAKLANHIAKKEPGFHWARDLAAMPQAKTDALLSGIEVAEIWGVGPTS